VFRDGQEDRVTARPRGQRHGLLDDVRGQMRMIRLRDEMQVVVSVTDDHTVILPPGQQSFHHIGLPLQAHAHRH
jgi:hypothetical protein